MDELVELQAIPGQSTCINGDNDYEMPAVFRDNENEYTNIGALAETLTDTIASEGTAVQTVDVGDVSKPEISPTAFRKIQILCVLLLTMILVVSVAFGMFVHSLMMRLDAAEMLSAELNGKVYELQNKSGSSKHTDAANIQDFQTKLQQLESKLEARGASIQELHTQLQQVETKINASEDNVQEVQTKLQKVEFKVESRETSFQDLQTRLQQAESKLEAKETSLDTTFETYANKITQLENDRSTLASMIQDQGSRITQLETETSVNEDDIRKHEAKISKLENDRAVDQTTIIRLNITLGQLVIDLSSNEDEINRYIARLEKTESDREVDHDDIKTLNASIMKIDSDASLHVSNIKALTEDLSTSIRALETNQTAQVITINHHTSRLHNVDIAMNKMNTTLAQLDINISGNISEIKTLQADFETNLANEIINTQGHSTRINHIETKMEATVRKLNQLETNFTSVDASVLNNSFSISQLNGDLKNTTHYLANLSSKTEAIEIDQKSGIALIEANTRRISTLEYNYNSTKSISNDMDFRLKYLEVFATLNPIQANINGGGPTYLYSGRGLNENHELNCTWGSWSMFSPCSAKCGEGFHYRERSCKDADGTYSGRWCSRSEIDIQTCNITQCKPGVMSAFTVYYPQAGSRYGTIRFTRVITNTGGQYNTSTGIFTCQYPGMYVFALHLENVYKERAYCYIRKDQSNFLRVSSSSGNSTSYYISSTHAVIHLDRGDEVDVGSCENIPGIFKSSDGGTSFSGFLLKDD